MTQAPSDTPHNFCTRADERCDQVRNEAIRTAVRTLISGIEGRVDIATQALHASVLYQASLAGVRL